MFNSLTEFQYANALNHELPSTNSLTPHLKLISSSTSWVFQHYILFGYPHKTFLVLFLHYVKSDEFTSQIYVPPTNVH